MSAEIIVVDDEDHLRTACTQALELAGFQVSAFPSAEGALDHVTRSWDGMLVTDIKMAGTDGLELMRRALQVDPDLPVVLISGHGDIPMAVQAMRDGAYDFIEKPFASEILVDAVKRGIEKRRLILENRTLRAQVERSSGLDATLIGRTPEIVRLRETVMSFAPTDADVLILGETGTGKELVARSLHEHSARSEQKFVPINCGALPDTIIESELFGHEAGAFTGASKTRIGKFEYADGGTLFLDEIESMPLDLQPRLLRVLQDRKIVRLGSNSERSVDVRVIAATKEDIRSATDQGRFREDLFYRLNVLTVNIPPLRERRDDVTLLFNTFLAQAAARFNRDIADTNPAAIAALIAHDWPGNVRELQNSALRYALGLGLEIEGSQPLTDFAHSAGRSLADQISAIEKQIIHQTLHESNGSLKTTYEALGISRKTLYDKMQRHGLSRASGDESDEPQH